MRNKIKSILIGLFFVAAVGFAYMTGLYSKGGESYPPGTSPPAEEASARIAAESIATPEPPAAPARTVGASGREVAPNHDPDPRIDRVNLEEYETADPQEKGSFRPDPYVLKQEFPDNMAVPPATREEFEARQAEREERQKMFGMITANKASREEIEAYYSEQERLARDSIEILTFILTEYKDQMNETDMKKHEFLLDRFYSRLDRIPEKKQEALARLASKN